MAIRLNLGSGTASLPGFINIDALPNAPGVDVVADLGEALPCRDESVDLIYVSHVLEHFPADTVPGLLQEWRRVLRPGGQLLIAVPNLDVIARLLVERSGWFTPPHNPWLGAIYGGQKDIYDFHKTGFTPAWLGYLLSEAGFGSITQVDVFDDLPVLDGSSSFAPFGINISLNMRASNGEMGLTAGLINKGFLERVFDVLDYFIYLALGVSSRLRHLAMLPRRRQLESTLDRSDLRDING